MTATVVTTSAALSKKKKLRPISDYDMLTVGRSARDLFSEPVVSEVILARSGWRGRGEVGTMNEVSMPEGGMEEKRVNFWGVHLGVGGGVRMLVIVRARLYRN